VFCLRAIRPALGSHHAQKRLCGGSFLTGGGSGIRAGTPPESRGGATDSVFDFGITVTALRNDSVNWLDVGLACGLVLGHGLVQGVDQLA